MSEAHFYPVGTPGQPWGAAEKAAWRSRQVIRRSYQQEVCAPIAAMAGDWSVEQYGVLAYPAGEYPLFALRTRPWDPDRPLVLVTGGVHGYETSGVHGAIRAAAAIGPVLGGRANVAIAPCVSPWGYETINRWNPDAVDPNRSFFAGSPSPEAAALMRFIRSLGAVPLMHIDLHETTDTDATEFRPAKAARDGLPLAAFGVQDGFYLVGHTERPVPGFQHAIIAAVEQITHIAEPDQRGHIIGVPLEQRGVINYDATRLGLCMGATAAAYTTTTEVYPDSPGMTGEVCILAQAASVASGLDYVLRRSSRGA